MIFFDFFLIFGQALKAMLDAILISFFFNFFSGIEGDVRCYSTQRLGQILQIVWPGKQYDILFYNNDKKKCQLSCVTR